MTHLGGYQCGQVRYQVEMDIDTVIACNCSRCGRIGSLLAFAPIESFRVLSGEDVLTTFEFNKHIIKHKFCKICGVQPFAVGRNPKTGTDMAAVNVRTIDGIDIGSLNVTQVDGKSF